MNRRSLPGIFAALAAAAGLALAASGCGSASNTLDPVAQAAQTTSRVAGFHMQFTGTASAPGLPGAVRLGGSGFFNPGTREGSMTMTFSGSALTTASGSPTGVLSMRELFTGAALYLSSPLFAGKLPNGARWMKVDLARAGRSLGIDLQSLTGGGENPAQFLEFLKGSNGSVTRVGAENVRGVPTTRYRATVDLERILARAPAAQRDALRRALAKLTAQIGMHQLPIEVWVDSHGMARRIAIAMSLHVNGQAAQFALSIDLFGFGATPPVQAPPAGETYEPSTAALGATG